MQLLGSERHPCDVVVSWYDAEGELPEAKSRTTSENKALPPAIQQQQSCEKRRMNRSYIDDKRCIVQLYDTARASHARYPQPVGASCVDLTSLWLSGLELAAHLNLHLCACKQAAIQLHSTLRNAPGQPVDPCPLPWCAVSKDRHRSAKISDTYKLSDLPRTPCSCMLGLTYADQLTCLSSLNLTRPRQARLTL